MAFDSLKYNGIFNELKKDYVNLSALFNTRDKNTNEKTSRFLVPQGAKINVGTAWGVCNKIPVTCNDVSQFDVIATEPLSVNEIMDDCLAAIEPRVVNATFDITAREWANTEVKYAYSITKTAYTDKTADYAADINIVNVKQEIIQAVKDLSTLGYKPADMVVAVGTDVYYDLMVMDILCCDINVMTADSMSVLNNKLGVGALVYVPTDILSGNIDGDVLTPAETVRFTVYIKDYAMIKTTCEVSPFIRDVLDKEYIGKSATNGAIAQISGKELIGLGIYDNTSGIVVFDEEAPAFDGKSKKVAKTDEVKK